MIFLKGDKYMKKFLLICFILFSPLLLFGCGKKETSEKTTNTFTTNQTTVNQATANQNVSESDEVILFVSSTCGHCANVKKFISDNEIQNKVQYKEIEAFTGQENTNLFNEKATICAIAYENRGVPLLFDKGKCYLGEIEVTDYFKAKAGIK